MVILLPFLVMVSCKGDDDTGENSPEPVYIWAGWNHTWDMLSHRISVSEAILEEDGTASVGLVGGDFSTGENATDGATSRVRFHEVNAADFTAVHGSTLLQVGPHEITVDTVVVDNPDLAKADQLVVVLRGFSLNTDVEQGSDYPEDYDPALGYTSRGFGFGVSDEPTVSGDQVSFEVVGRVRWGPNGEDDPIDRSDMNGAIPSAWTGLEVAWTVIGFSGQASWSTTSASEDMPSDPPYSEQPPLGPGTLDLELDGSGPGFAALVDVDLEVSVIDNPEQGEYLRSTGAELIPDETLSPPVHLEAEITNSSIIETAEIHFSPTIRVAWLGLDDAEAEVVPGFIEGPHDVGFATLP